MKRAQPLSLALCLAPLLTACADGDPVPPGSPRAGALSNPPPISGGTLLISRDRRVAVAADPDRDRVSLVDLEGGRLLATVPLQPGDEPGRVAEDDSGRFHVALRAAGALATLSRTGELLARTPVCAAPRGVAFSGALSRLLVACASGELVSLSGGVVLRSDPLGRDLRDVVPLGNKVYVSRFKSAELLEVDALTGQILRVGRTRPLHAARTDILPGEEFQETQTGHVAWRLAPIPDSGQLLMVHQRSSNFPLFRAPLPGSAGHYYGPPVRTCGKALVNSAVTIFDPALPTADGSIAVRSATTLPAIVLPVDASSDGGRVIVAGAGSSLTQVSGLRGLSFVDPNHIVDDCAAQAGVNLEEGPPSITAVAYRGDLPVVQTREPASLVIGGQGTVYLGGESRAHVGHALFHTPTPSGLACASCHPEGHEDGFAYNFRDTGPRRTQTLRGGIKGTEPFHWNGEIRDFPHLISEVLVRRMGAPLSGVPNAEDTASLVTWLDRIAALPPPATLEAEQVARGRALFFGEARCGACHSGPHYTNNQTVDVGTGAPLQVPTLVGVGHRAPFLHDGRAATLRDRFAPSGGGDQHGATSQLTKPQLADLVAFMESL